jgi:MinD superfamily P-loop ATPase
MPKPFEIVVISGKGGTGKTVFTSCLASIFQDKVVADCDVDAPDLHLLFTPLVKRQEVFPGTPHASIDPDKCTSCDRCFQVCRFGAVVPPESGTGTIYRIDDLACEGCAVCEWTCPAGAISMVAGPSGKWFVSDTRFGTLVHAKLGVAQENSGKLVTVVREEARKAAIEKGCRFVVIDGPPGIGCPVIASVAGADLAVAVTEPTLSGVHDLERVLELTSHFGVKTGVIINKFDLNGEIVLKMEQFLESAGIPLLGKIRFDTTVNRAIGEGRTVIEYSESEVAREMTLAAEETIALANQGLDVKASTESRGD